MITTFPEKWATKLTEQVAEYTTKKSVRKHESLYEKSEEFVHFPAIELDKGADSEGNPRGPRLYHLFDTVQEGYTQITEEEFFLCNINSPEEEDEDGDEDGDEDEIIADLKNEF